jgi:hypothetical protein
MKKEIKWGSISIKGLEDENYDKFLLKDLQQKEIGLYGSKNSKDNAKKVYEYDLNGNFKKEYENAMMASEELNINWANIYHCIYGMMNQCNKSIWTDTFYEKLPKDILEKGQNSKWVRYDRPIYQYDKYGKLLKEYDNLKQTSLKRGVQSNIRRCLYGELKQTQNCFWSFIKFEQYPFNMISFRKAKQITQFDLNGNKIQDWISITDAATTLNLYNSHISNCLRGLKENYADFIWKYKN